MVYKMLLVLSSVKLISPERAPQTVLHCAQVLEPTSNCSNCSTSLIQEDSEEAAPPGLTFGIGTGPHCGCGPQMSSRAPLEK